MRRISYFLPILITLSCSNGSPGKLNANSIAVSTNSSHSETESTQNVISGSGQGNELNQPTDRFQAIYGTLGSDASSQFSSAQESDDKPPSGYQAATFAAQVSYPAKVTFPDIQSHPHRAQIESAVSMGFLKGMPGNSFQASTTLTREQAADVLLQVLKSLPQIPVPSVNLGNSPFKDVAKNRWSLSAILTLHQLKILTGYSDGTFKPTANITRATWTSALENIRLIVEKQTGSFERRPSSTFQFKDLSKSPALSAIQNLSLTCGAAFGSVKGKAQAFSASSELFEPEKIVTRAYAALGAVQVTQCILPKLENKKICDQVSFPSTGQQGLNGRVGGDVTITVPALVGDVFVAMDGKSISNFELSTTRVSNEKILLKIPFNLNDPTSRTPESFPIRFYIRNSTTGKMIQCPSPSLTINPYLGKPIEVRAIASRLNTVLKAVQDKVGVKLSLGAGTTKLDPRDLPYALLSTLLNSEDPNNLSNMLSLNTPELKDAINAGLMNEQEIGRLLAAFDTEALLGKLEEAANSLAAKTDDSSKEFCTKDDVSGVESVADLKKAQTLRPIQALLAGLTEPFGQLEKAALSSLANSAESKIGAPVFTWAKIAKNGIGLAEKANQAIHNKDLKGLQIAVKDIIAATGNSEKDLGLLGTLVNFPTTKEEAAKLLVAQGSEYLGQAIVKSINIPQENKALASALGSKIGGLISGLLGQSTVQAPGCGGGGGLGLDGTWIRRTKEKNRNEVFYEKIIISGSKNKKDIPIFKVRTFSTENLSQKDKEHYLSLNPNPSSSEVLDHAILNVFRVSNPTSLKPASQYENLGLFCNYAWDDYDYNKKKEWSISVDRFCLLTVDDPDDPKAGYIDEALNSEGKRYYQSLSKETLESISPILSRSAINITKMSSKEILVQIFHPPQPHSSKDSFWWLHGGILGGFNQFQTKRAVFYLDGGPLEILQDQYTDPQRFK